MLKQAWLEMGAGKTGLSDQLDQLGKREKQRDTDRQNVCGEALLSAALEFV